MKNNLLKKILIIMFLIAVVVFGFLIPYYSHPKVVDGYIETKEEAVKEIKQETSKYVVKETIQETKEELKDEEVINNNESKDKENVSDDNKENDNNIQLVENEIIAKEVTNKTTEDKEKQETMQQDKEENDLHNKNDIESNMNEEIEISEENDIINNTESQEDKTLEGIVEQVKEEENINDEIVYSEDWVEQKINENRDVIDDADLNDFRTIIGKLDMDYISKLSENLGTDEGELKFKEYLHSRLTDTEYSISKKLFIKYRDILFD